MELLSAKEDLEKQKDSVLAQELQTKWYQNQLAIETEAHQVCIHDDACQNY
jgi:hypothetical protein